MRLILSSLMLLAAAGTASATGGISCNIDDAAVRLDLTGVTTRGMGYPVFSLTARLEIDDEALADDLRVTEFDKAHLAQHWSNAGTVKLILYRERDGAGAHGYVEIGIDTFAQDQDLAGDYVLTVYDDGAQKRFIGAVFCSVE